ncbi:MAG TPA: secretin N-terminal domain-containing protein [Bacillota bacterium]|nr:secretin N-terminal domain-containing protein [Bacillota bacterium]
MRNKLLLVTFGLILTVFTGLGTWGLAATPTQPKPEVLTRISFYKADLVAVLQQLAGECGYNVIVTPEVQGTVTVQFQQVTFEEVLQYLMQSQGLVYEKKGRNILIGKVGQLQSDQKSIGYFRIYFAEPQKIADILKKVIPTAEIVADERTRMVVVQGSKSLIEQVGGVVQSLDRKMEQITIEVKVVEVSVSALRQLGVNWEIGDASLDWGVTSSGADLILKMIKDGYTWNMIIRNLMSDGNARLVTAPSVSTVDGKPASILIGDKVPLETKDADGNISVTYQEVGVKLNFTPWVQQTDDIRLDLMTQVNSLGEKVGNNYTIKAREVSSRIQAKIGETLFIGGLISHEERNTLSKVPVLADIPLLGKLFRNTEKAKEETELIVTITPRWTHSIQIKNNNNLTNPEVKQTGK